MSPDEEEKWKLKVTGTLSEIHSDQKNLSKKLDAYVAGSDKRIDALEKAVNGPDGVASEVKNIKTKWAAIYAVGVFLGATIVQAAASSFFK